MRVLIVTPQQNRISGNRISAERLQAGLIKLGHQAVLYETPLQPQADFHELLIDFSPQIALLLHAYRSGLPWLTVAEDLAIPWVTFLTGTDINDGLDHPEQQSVITTVLNRSAAIVTQSSTLAEKVSACLPRLTDRLKIIAPGIVITEAEYQLRDQLPISDEQTLFLLPAGIRPVKGVIELLQRFDPLTGGTIRFHLALCGPILDPEYGSDFLRQVDSRSWATYLGAIPRIKMCGAMREADVILNNSRSEGLANSLLEATTLGVPVLARRIPGNLLIIEHGQNGLLFEDQADFCRYATELLNPSRRSELSRPAPDRYDPAQESSGLVSILESVLSKGTKRD